MSTIFISDLHLSVDRPEMADLFIAFTQNQAKTADALYILGDFFDIWVGDDNQNEFNQKIIAALKDLSNHTPITIMHGNHDFMLRKRFAAESGCTLITDDEIVIDLYGQKTLLMHGDTLCTDDIKYQKYRKRMRQKWFLALLLWVLPLKTRLNIARKMQDKSHSHKGDSSFEIMDVTDSAVVDIMEKYNVTRLIHGHTHRQAVHELTVNGKHAERIVLGDWFVSGSYLSVSDDGEVKSISL